MKTALVLGAGGFIGSHLVRRLKSEGYWVRGVDLKYPEFWATEADHFIIGDLRNPNLVLDVFEFAGYNKNPWDTYASIANNKFDEVYQLAADMGGAGFVFTGAHDADILHNSALINLNVSKCAVKCGVNKIFYSSSACIYPARNQTDPNNPKCSEDTAYPADPDSEYGWEKLFSEHLYKSFEKNYGLNVRIARFHNIFGPYGTWSDGREKAPAAFCRKIAEISDGGEIEMWGDGKQTRSFLYIDECLDGIRRLMDSNYSEPINIGSEEMVSINKLAEMITEISNKNIHIKHIDGPLGVRGRNSDNTLIRSILNWEPKQPLYDGLVKTYNWINEQVHGKE